MGDHWKDRLAERRAPKWDSFSWVTVKALFESVNDVFAKAQPEIIDERRLRWTARLRASAPAVADAGDEWGRLVVDYRRPSGEPAAFFIIGDTGEQDASQYAAIPLLEGRPGGHGVTYRDPDGNEAPPEFVYILSDVIYPAGNINEYFNGFYLPYRGIDAPIYAVPGNHDWYDGLNGFMFNFCGAEPLPRESFRQTEVAIPTRLMNWLWRGSEEPHRAELSELRDGRPQRRNARKAVQPAPYFAIDLGDLLLVGIDTGVTGPIDDEQGRWLLEVSKRPQQKVLLTGKPICVDNDYHPGEIHWKPNARGMVPRFSTVDEIVREPLFGYVAAIGGDVHNYQRYPMLVDGRELPYIVSGGGGAYLSPTHRIPPVGDASAPEAWPWPEGMTPPRDSDLPPAPAGDREFACYPSRGLSLSFTAKGAGPRLFNGVQLLCAALVFALGLALFDVAPRGSVPRHGILAAYVPLVVIAAVYGLVLRRFSKRLAAAIPQGKFLLGLCGIVVVFALVAWGADGLSDEELLSNGRFWATFGVALAVPGLLLGGIILAHDLRHSIPGSLPSVLTAAAAAASVPIFFGLSIDGVPDWLTVAVAVALLLGALTAILIAARTTWLFEQTGTGAPTPKRRVTAGFLVLRGALIAGPTLLAWALIRATGADWIAWAALAALGAAAVPAILAAIAGTGADPPHVDPGSAPWRAWLAATNYVVGVAWVAAYLGLLSLAGDGWLATSAAGGPAILLVIVAVPVFLLLALGSGSLSSWLLPVTALALIVFGIWQAWIDWWAFALFGAAIVAEGALGVWRLRLGRLDPDRAQRRIEAALAGTEAADELTPEERSLFKRLYRRPRGSGPGSAERTNEAAEVVARLLAELGDSDQPPFPKHFLRCDVRPAAGGEGELELVIRAFPYTGTEDVDDPQPVPFDTVTIPFRSREGWAQLAHANAVEAAAAGEVAAD